MTSKRRKKKNSIKVFFNGNFEHTSVGSKLIFKWQALSGKFVSNHQTSIKKKTF